MTGIDIEVSEVGPRDGLQNTKQFMPTAAKQAWIAAEAAAGVREIEVCSFVPPKLIPQFSDANEVVAHALAIPGLSVAALVPNLKGAERAVAAGVHKLSFPLSVSKGHSLSNVRKTPDEQLQEFRRIAEFLRSVPKEKRPGLSGGLSTAFGCTIDGPVDEDDVVRLAVGLAEAGADDVSLADTVGYANPAQIKRVFTSVRREIGGKLTGAHLHNTRGLGLANAVAAIDCGVRTLDASLGGLGGCPYAPGASGNIVTEDLVFMLEAMGLRTGIDLGKLLAVRRQVEAALPGAEFHGNIAAAGLPKGYAAAAE
jgi:hydroxymethylglutaryl-CoA lyase